LNFEQEFKGKKVKNMKKKGLKLALILLSILIMNCHLLQNEENADEIDIYFMESNVSIIGVEGIASLTLKIEPAEKMIGYNVEYEVSNENIAVIIKADRRGCVLMAKDIGSVIVTARVLNAEAKAVVNVIKM
jgi:hypothetical protein